MDAVDVAVVGGGVIGCSVAYHAARSGAKVVLVEAEGIGGGASGAAAGMLAAQAEAHEPGPFLDLLLASRDLHGPLGEELRERTGLDPEYAWSGTLSVASSVEGERDLYARYSWQAGLGLSARWLSGEEARDLEPALSPDVSAALYLPEDGQVNSPRLVQALVLAATERGVWILDFTRVTGFVTESGRVTGVRTARGEIPAGAVVLCGGASSGILAEDLGVNLPVYPVKGEVLAVGVRPAPTRANVWGERCYAVPKRDGRMIVGATEEPGVHDRRPTLGGVARLSAAALDLIPTLKDAPFLNAWGGLRPATPTGRPILGAVEGWDGLLVATGHYRNGVLLAPITGKAISEAALGEAPSVDLRPFAPTALAGQEAL
ncbi:MAG: glycine oxidase ThiO [Rubrobacter sp.]|nr:glycine oxidase ThiO [Rubrobacter sp.]